MAALKEEIINRLGLFPRPEGGWAAKVFTHRCGATIAGVAGYVLVSRENPLSLSRVRPDQTWAFLEGSCADILTLLPDGEATVRRFTPASGQGHPLLVVPGGCWRAVKCEDWSLFAVTSVPAPGAAEIWDGSDHAWDACPSFRGWTA